MISFLLNQSGEKVKNGIVQKFKRFVVVVENEMVVET